MFLKTNLDMEKEAFLIFLWLLPLIPMMAIFVLFLWYSHISWLILMIALFWFIVWGFIYRIVHTEICFEGEKITLCLRKKKYVFSPTDILYIEESTFYTNPLQTHIYKLYMQPEVEIPCEFIYIRNRKIQKNLSKLFPDVPVKRNVII